MNTASASRPRIELGREAQATGRRIAGDQVFRPGSKTDLAARQPLDLCGVLVDAAERLTPNSEKHAPETRPT